jgi:hypothetical protein
MALTKHETATSITYLNEAHKRGDTVKGYLKTVKQITGGKFGPQWAFVMIDKDADEEKTVVAGGSAKYVAMNLAMHLGLLEIEPKAKGGIERDKGLLGFYIEISPNGSYQNKTGQTVNSFEIAVDKDLPLEGV